jgi:tetracycline resistance efflux pump
MIPMNFYAILTIILVIYTAYSNFNIALMVQHEERALEGHLYYEGAGAPESTINIKEGKNGRVFELFLAVFILVFVTIAALVYTGYSAMNGQGHEFGLIEALEASDVGLSLVYGSGSALLTALLFTLGKGLNWLEIIKTVIKGSFTMKDALVVLTAAWLIGAVIMDIHTGQYIASIVEEHLNLALLPALIFTLSAIMAFATGTSWGTFGIMIAITVNIATASDPEQMLVLLSAVLSGAVMGDHCSPISDTTILSSIGARSNHIDHVKTQLPYALLSGSAALCGFLVLGMTESLALAWLAAFALFLVLIAGLKKLYPASA